MEPYRAYLEARFVDDPHVRASVLFGELVPLGFDRSYPTLVREIRELGLRPVCDCCKAGGVKVTVGLDHEPGEELQLDWLELPETPWGEKAYVLVGALSHSGRVRGVFADGMTFAHLIEALDGVLRRLGGTTRSWRTDRMATVVYPGTDRLRPEAAAAAKHYGVTVAVCPGEPAAAQGRRGEGDRLRDAVVVASGAGVHAGGGAGRSGPLVRRRLATAAGAGTSTVGELAAAEPLLALPRLAFPAEHQAERVVADDALVAFESQPLQRPARLRGADGHRAGAARVTLHLEIYSQAGRRIARHRRAPNGAGQIAPPARSTPGCSSRPSSTAFTTTQEVSAQAEPAARRTRAGRGRPVCAARTPAAWSSISISTRGSRRSQAR